MNLGDFFVSLIYLHMAYKFVLKNPQKYECNVCDYYTCNKKDYTKHVLTQKHKILTINLQKSPKIPNCEIIENNICECGNIYKHRQSLHKHKKTCHYIQKCYSNNGKNHEKNNENTEANINNKDDIIELLIKQNNDLIKEQYDIKQMILEIVKNGTNNTNTNTNSHNKTFNLQVFLNETCKDAMNISEFIENISLQLSDLENMGKLGYVDGISNIIIKNLNALDVTQRPLHCTDKKREIVYVKEDDEWQKEQEDKKRINSVISSVVSKNLKLLPEYEDKYPECMNPESKKSDEYNKIIMETIGGGTDVVERNKEKIIRKVAKSVTIDKID